MFKRSWANAAKARNTMKFGIAVTFLVILATIYFRVFQLRPFGRTALVYYAALIVGPLCLIFGFIGWIYNRTSTKSQQLSVRVLSGYEEESLVVIRSTQLRIGRADNGESMVTNEGPPDKYWSITTKKGDWVLRHVTGSLPAKLNGEPILVPEVEISMGDQIEIDGIHLIFDTVKANQR